MIRHFRKFHQISQSTEDQVANLKSLTIHSSPCKEEEDERNEEVLNCCDETFRNKWQFNKHLRFKHNREPQLQYICLKCPEDNRKAFQYASLLARHEKKHLKVSKVKAPRPAKTFTCFQCVKAASEEFQPLGSDDQRKDIIESSFHFSKWSEFLNHRKMYHKLECNECPKDKPPRRFSTMQALKHHIFKKHNNIRHSILPNREEPNDSYNLQCSRCDFRFRRPYLLDLHIKTKHENKRFHCIIDNCRSSYQSKQRLRLHFKKIHPEIIFTSEMDKLIKLS
ncbi:MAG: hypothetical protein MHMPM18_003426, partial [Marteilia pararefringens]